MSSVLLGDLNDFIQPEQACTNPLFVSVDMPKEDKSAPRSQKGRAKISLDSGIFSGIGDSTSRPDLIKSTGAQKKATVSLNDCLACSGCVTSAETVLISQQSGEEFLNTLKSQVHKRIVVSISPPSRAALATHFGLSLADAHRKVVKYFKDLGVHDVLDTTATADLALIEAQSEFLVRFKQRQMIKWQSAPPSTAQSWEKTTYTDMDDTEAAALETDPYTACPMLTSACPGWVCYAEKTQPNVLPYISTTKSPQQIMGTLVKRLLYKDCEGIQPNEVYHVTVMPCYDKKLEASRKDFYDEGTDANDVDCVLSTDEVLKLMAAGEDDSAVSPTDEGRTQDSNRSVDNGRLELSMDFPEPGETLKRRRLISTPQTAGTGMDLREDTELIVGRSSASLEGKDGDTRIVTHLRKQLRLECTRNESLKAQLSTEGHSVHKCNSGSGETGQTDTERLMSCWSSDAATLVGQVAENGGSGGYLEHVFRFAAKALYGVTIDGPLEYHAGRNKDFKEVFLEVNGEKVLRFALAYGFRNIQTIITKIKRSKCPYHFVEIMACPSGCVNGGGQIKAKNVVASRELINDVSTVFHTRRIRHPEQGDICRQLYPKYFGGQPFSSQAKKYLHTRYHVIPKMEIAQPFGIKW